MKIQTIKNFLCLNPTHLSPILLLFVCELKSEEANKNLLEHHSQVVVDKYSSG